MGRDASSIAACPLHHTWHDAPPPLRFTARGRIRPSSLRGALATSNPDSRASHLDCFADARNDAQVTLFSRRDSARALPTTTPFKNRRRPERKAKRRKAHANHVPRNISKRRRLLMYRRRVYAVCATHLLRGCAPYGARSPSGASTAALAVTPITAQLQAMLPGTWTARDPERAWPDLIGVDTGFPKDHAHLTKPAGVTRALWRRQRASKDQIQRGARPARRVGTLWRIRGRFAAPQDEER